ncbi:MAG: TRAM domain-containing protein, partial [Gammaproteobacteria bacterium]
MARRRTRKKPLPQSPVRATIESFSHDGRGLAHVDGKVTFIDAALPGEEVEFVYTDSHRDYAEGRVETLLTRSKDRAEPGCPHYGVCGGCSFQHVESAAQIRIKETLLEDQIRRIGRIDVLSLWEPLTGPHWGYRHKARMGVKYVEKKGRVLVGFRERRQQFLADIRQCPVMHPSVGTKLTDLAEMIAGLTVRDKIPQIEVAIGDDDCVLAVRVLDPP